MRFDLDIMFVTTIGIALFLILVLFKENKNQQAEINELRIIIDNKFLPSMILDQTKIR